MFGEWVPKEWIQAVLDEIRKYPQHTFQLLTKNPKRYREFKFPENCWLGTTMDGTERTQNNIVYLMAGRETRIENRKVINNKVFISFEPLLAEIETGFPGVDWIIIGANSNKGALKAPDTWADDLIAKARKYGTAVWVKDNYNYHTKIKEFPR